jgi:hypothetical protein
MKAEETLVIGCSKTTTDAERRLETPRERDGNTESTKSPATLESSTLETPRSFIF